MRKKVILLFIVAVNVFMLTGCWNYVEINAQINVSGLAIDVGHQGRKFHLSAEALLVSGSEKSEIKTTVIETESDTVFEGIRNLMTLATKKLYFGHCKSVIISEDVAKNGISEVLDMTIRNHELRISMDVVIAKGCDAKCILMSTGVANPSTAYKIYDLMNTSELAVGGAPITKTYLIFNSTQTEGFSTVIPALEIRNVEELKVLKLAGVAVFKEDKLIGYLDELQTKYLSLLTDKINRSGLLTIKVSEKPGLFVSYEIYKNKTKTKLQFDEETLNVKITTDTVVTIGEVQTQADFSNPEELEMARMLLENHMEEDLNKLIYTSQTKLDSDILGIGTQMQIKYPDMWEKYKDNWDETFKKINISVDCIVKINGSGISSKTSERNKPSELFYVGSWSPCL